MSHPGQVDARSSAEHDGHIAQIRRLTGVLLSNKQFSRSSVGVTMVNWRRSVGNEVGRGGDSGSYVADLRLRKVTDMDNYNSSLLL